MTKRIAITTTVTDHHRCECMSSTRHNPTSVDFNFQNNDYYLIYSNPLQAIISTQHM